MYLQHFLYTIPFKHNLARTASTKGPSILMRSSFFPKKTRQCFENTKKLQPDIVVLDLEDSVQSDEKPIIRKAYIEGIKDGLFSNMNVIIRTSSLKCTEELSEDLKTFTGSGILGFVLPKVETPESILEAESLIAKAEKEKGLEDMTTKLIPLVETSAAHFCMDKIVSSTKRIIAILAGSGDLTADIVCDDHSATYDSFFSNVVLAAKSVGIMAICGVHDKLDDHVGFEKYCLKMKKCGFSGVVALTPKQVILANQLFSLSPKEKEWTDNVLSSEKQLKTIQRCVQESRQMVGPPHKIKAENMVMGMVHIQPKPSNPIKGTYSVRGICPQLGLGEVVSAPQEVLITESWRTAWDSSFISLGGYNAKYSQVAGIPNQPLPFAFATSMAVAFSVSSLSYHARVHLGFKNIFQERPLLTGDRVHAMFRIDSVNSKKGGDSNQYTVASTTHWLVNQANEVILQLEKVTMFQPNRCNLHHTDRKHTKSLEPNNSRLQNSLLKYPTEKFFPLTSHRAVTPGELLIHDVVKVMGESETRMLCTLIHIINPHHHNIIRYEASDLLVPGPFVMSAGISNASLDLGEVIYEDIPFCINPNKVNFGDQLGSMTYIMESKQVQDIPEYEEVTMKHVVVKNMDMEVISKMDLPQELFENGNMKPSEYEGLCAKACPILLHKIACVMVRRIIRVRPGLTMTNNIPHEIR